MGENTSTNPTPSGQVPNGTDLTGQVPTPQGQVPNGSSQNVSLDTLPQAVQDYIKDLREKDASARVELKKFQAAQKRQEEEAAEATRKQLEEQGKFKELAEQSQARVKELEPYQERYNQLATQLSAQIKTQIKDWPPEVKAFDPGEDAPIEQRLAWIEKSKPIVEKLQGKGREAGNGPNPPHVAGSQATRKQQKEEYREQRMKRGGYVL